MIEISAFRTAMARLGAAVNIITTAGPDGRHGMTASAVCSVSDDPATVLVCIHRSARMSTLVAGHGRFAVNVLTAAQESASRAFADRALAMEARFAACGPWTTVAGDLPALETALVVLGCKVESAFEIGTHIVFIGRVEAIRLGEEDAQGLVYFDRRYHALASQAAAPR